MVNKKNIILIFILALAAFLRLWKLGSYPALNADEAAIGYNAWSLLETSLDEHGNSWPIHFQSFNDYKPGLYFYIVLPFVKLMGLSEWAIRLPGALFGVATVWVVYMLVKELGRNRFMQIKERINTDTWGLVSALFLAISPWHIHFSRGGWEVNVATFFIAFGILLFLKALKNPKYFVLCTSAFVLSLYTYHAARVVVPLLGLGLTVFYKDKLIKNLRSVAVAAAIGLILVTPLAYDLTKGEILSRAAGVGLFADPGPLARINEQRGEHGDFTSIIPKALHNKPINYGLAFMQNWGEHFWGEFLFLTGDEIQRNKVPETGQMYLFDILFLLAGVLGIIKLVGGKHNSHPEHFDETQRKPVSESIKGKGDLSASLKMTKSKIPDQVRNGSKGIYIIFWWLLVAPTAAALTFQSPHALRSHNMVVPLTIISAYGLVYLSFWLHRIMGIDKKDKRSRNVGAYPFRDWKLSSRKRFLNAIFVIFILFVSWNFTRYLHMYWVHMAKEYPFSSQYGVKELVEYVKENEENYDNILVTDRYDQPYILFLFYLKYPPQDFQNDHALTPRDKFGFSTVRDYGKYHFENIVWDVDQPSNPNSLIIGTDEEIPDEANIIKEIYGSNGYKYFQIVAN